MRSIRCRLACGSGFTLIEVLVAILVLSVGILALVSSFGSAQRLTLTAERRTSLVHRAQREVERLEAVPYGELAMVSKPAHSTEESNPDHYVDYNSPVTCKEVKEAGCYAWNSEALTEEEPIVLAEASTGKSCKEEVIAGCGEVSATPKSWSEGNVSGKTYTFVTWQTDGSATKPYCGEGCPAENDYKRITVVVTVNVPSGTHTVTPVKVSTLIANPSAAAGENTGKNPLTTPGTSCGGKLCTASISGNAISLFLHDSSAAEDEATGEVKVLAPTKSEATHPTVAPEKGALCESSNPSGCPKPDMMSSAPPTTSTLYDYSTDQNSLGSTITAPAGTTTWKCPGVESEAHCYGGRALQRSTAECKPGEAGGPKPTAENQSNELWVSPPLASATTLTGSGGLSLYTQTVGGLSAAETLCVAIYDVEENVKDIIEKPPELIAYTRYSSTSWPASLQELSFTFDTETEPKLEFISAEHTIAEKHRIGLRLWTAAAATYPITLVYDTAPDAQTETAGYPALLQLNTE